MQSISASDQESALARGVAWLLKQQAADGGWHSQAYGQLKGGAAVTALVLDTLSQLPTDSIKKYEAAINRGFQFLRAGFVKRRTIASTDGSLDFPTYGSALFLTATVRLALKSDEIQKQAKLAREYLLSAQLLETRGFATDHPSYGGWDFLGADDAQGITTGTNVSVVAHVLEAFVDYESTAAEKARAAAKGWLLRCQQADGGFAFTPEPMSLNNKAEFADQARTKPRSYGTATCDGIRGLLALDLPVDDANIKRAIIWLSKNAALEVVPGFEALPAETEWRRGLRFYYYCGLARILPQLPAADQPDRQQAIERILLKEQQADGRWQNESDRMRENDPLIATSFAVSTLTQLTAA